MAGHDDGKAGPQASIPSWQRAQASTSDEQSGQKQDEPSLSPPPKRQIGEGSADGDSPTTLEQAAKFLEAPEVKNESDERKVAFLQGKGLSNEDIEKLLANHPNQAGASQTKVVHTSANETKVTPPSQTIISSQVTGSPTAAPPIVTYPEFLVQSRRPPPLVTKERLFTTAYLTGGVVATLYGLSKYVVGPMSDSLAAARHELFEHAGERVEELDARIEKLVSKVPPKSNADALLNQEADIMPSSPTDSDPTELFHRDIGTQTTPDLDLTSETDAAPTKADTLTQQQTQVDALGVHVKALREAAQKQQDSRADLMAELVNLTSYLNNMSYGYPSDFPVTATDRYPSGAGGTAKPGEDEVDEIKAEIKSVKGVLLSARNFPAGGGSALGVR